MNKGDRSGDLSLDRDSEYCREKWGEIRDKTFRQTVFCPSPALVGKELVNGWRMWQPYDGASFDQKHFDVVENMWDHEHCSVCNARIETGNTYWFNAGRIGLLCDECHDFFDGSSS